MAPVFLELQATIDKTCSLIREAAKHGAQVIVFPETYIPAFPVWCALRAPIYNHDLFCTLAALTIATMPCRTASGNDCMSSTCERASETWPTHCGVGIHWPFWKDPSTIPSVAADRELPTTLGARDREPT